MFFFFITIDKILNLTRLNAYLIYWVLLSFFKIILHFVQLYTTITFHYCRTRRPSYFIFNNTLVMNGIY